jgi:hypothetical protein
MSDTDALRGAIRHLHGCGSTHVESVPVHESFEGHTVWDGTVEVFALAGHPIATRCYAWTYKQDDGSDRFLAVLHSPPVDSPLAAVRAMIVADHKNQLG